MPTSVNPGSGLLAAASASDWRQEAVYIDAAVPWMIAQDIEDALWEATSRRVRPADLRPGVLSQAIVARSRRYTSERDQIHASVAAGARDADLAARALFFTVADAAKIMIPLAELERASLLPAGEEISVLDLGAGIGAMSLGMLDYMHRRGILSGRRVVIRAVDTSARALDLMADAVKILARRWEISVSVERECGDAIAAVSAARPVAPPVAGQTGHRFDLVLFGGLLNELAAPERQSLVRGALAAARPHGSVVAVEPALRQTARDLHQLRDWVLEHGLAGIFAPCVRQTSPCPVLADERDWCHEDRVAVLPRQATRLAAATGLREHGLKFAYLVLRSEARPSSESLGSGVTGSLAGNLGNNQEQAVFRIISRLHKTKGKVECFACGEAGRVLLRRLRRHRSPDNRPFERLSRGDIAAVPAELAGGGDIEKATAVTSLAVEVPSGERSH